jgi:ADP-ribose pyrophosphatase YjhB (NUDIX family)
MEEKSSLKIINCKEGCCKFIIEPYVENYKHSFRRGNCKKSGVCLFDKTKNKILLVMSKGNLWGIPKGSLEVNMKETFEDCALRELKEETGVVLKEENLLYNTNVGENAFYFYSEIEEGDVKVQSNINNDANGIGWVNLYCLEKLIKKQTISLNYHTKIVLKAFFGKKWNFGLK